jgi:hypothetical protein
MMYNGTINNFILVSIMPHLQVLIIISILVLTERGEIIDY